MPASIKQTLRGAVLDATTYNLTGLKLQEQILKDVKDSQLFAGLNLPDRLLVTREQFNSLEHDLERMEDTKDRMMITPLNVMEVEVVE